MIYKNLQAKKSYENVIKLLIVKKAILKPMFIFFEMPKPHNVSNNFRLETTNIAFAFLCKSIYILYSAKQKIARKRL
jgi:hypothetical protein